MIKFNSEDSFHLDKPTFETNKFLHNVPNDIKLDSLESMLHRVSDNGKNVEIGV